MDEPCSQKNDKRWAFGEYIVPCAIIVMILSLLFIPLPKGGGVLILCAAVVIVGTRAAKNYMDRKDAEPTIDPTIEP